MFNQQLKTCHWWFFVDCETSELYYNLEEPTSEAPVIKRPRIRRDYLYNQFNRYDGVIGGDNGRRKTGRLRRRIPRQRKVKPRRYGTKHEKSNSHIETRMDKIVRDIYEVLSYFHS